MSGEPYICPECERAGTKVRGKNICVHCEREYNLGREDVERHRFNTMIGGDEYAAQEELANYLRFGDDY